MFLKEFMNFSDLGSYRKRNVKVAKISKLKYCKNIYNCVKEYFLNIVAK